VRKILDDSGYRDAKIMATGDLNEYKILELIADGAPIDSFGVGTELATSSDAPNHGAVYKLVEMRSGEERRYVAKLSADKSTLPGPKQIFRFGRKDLLACSHESHHDAREALLEPVILNGELVQSLPSATEAQTNARQSLDRLPKKLRSLFECDTPWPVETSQQLQHLTEEVRLAAR
jgi:nicotinate phosphoribosyltransferase